MEFHQILRKERVTRGWSQAMLAQELGTTPNTVSAWERGLSLPSPYFRTKLCELLGKNAIELNLVQADNEETTLPSLTPPAHEPVPIDLGPAPKEAPQQEEATLLSVKWEHQRKGFWRERRRLLVAGCALLIVLAIGGGILFALPGLRAPANPYGGQGSLALSDALQEQSQQMNWQEGWNENRASCQFKRGAYYSYQPLEGYFHACMAQATDFTNFAYEVDMTLLQGDYGGLIFRAVNSIDSKYYYFRVYGNGSYMLKRYVSKADADALLLDQGSARLFHAGYGQTNRLAVVANASQLRVYINGQELVSLTDTAYGHGQIGVFAGNDTHTPAEAAFSNVRVWSW